MGVGAVAVIVHGDDVDAIAFALSFPLGLSVSRSFSLSWALCLASLPGRADCGGDGDGGRGASCVR